MKHLITKLGFICLISLIALSTNAQYTKDSLFADLQVMLDQKAPQYGIEGSAISVILKDNSTWTGVNGIRDQNDPVDPNLHWNWGSISKSLVTAVALQLVEEGSLSLSDMIGMHLDTDTIPNVDSAISILSLLNHTNSLSDGWVNPSAFWSAVWGNRSAIWNISQTLQYTPPPVPNPNFEHRYQGHINFEIMALIIQEVTGNSITVEIENRIFNPLNMTSALICDTAYDMSNLNGVFANNSNRSGWNHNSYLTSRTGFNSNIEDLTKFMRALHSGQLLNSTSMFNLHNPIPTPNGGPIPCGGNVEVDYGLGTLIPKMYFSSGDTLIAYGHSGTGISKGSVFHAPDSGWTLAVVGNEFDNPFIDALVFDAICFMVENPVVPTTTALNSNQNNVIYNVNIYPNPAQDLINIDLSTALSLEIEMYDLLGRKVFEYTNDGSPKSSYQMLLPSDIISGQYLIKINDGQRQSAKRIQVK